MSDIDIYTVQDNAETPTEPISSTTFSNYGITDFDVQYWNGSGWTTVTGGSVTGNNKVWKKLNFTAVTTTGIRVTIHNALANRSRIVELEAWGTAGVTPSMNVAAASNGATATAQNYTLDSVYPGSHFQSSFANDGTRYCHLLSNGSDGTGFWRDEHGLSSWLEVAFSGAQTIGEIDVYTVGNYPELMTQADPTATQTFTQFGATAFEVQYWTGSGWVTVPNGSITGNNLVWRKINFAPITTSKIRVLVHAAADGVARLAEVEAWTPATSGSTANISWLVTDQLGTPRMIFDKTGALANVKRHDYLPFGEDLSSVVGLRSSIVGYAVADSVRQKFTDKERDNETGLDYFLARYYSSTQGRFTSPDD